MDSSIEILQASSSQIEKHMDLRTRALDSKLYVPSDAYRLQEALYRGTPVERIYLLEKDGKPIGVATVGNLSKKKGSRLLQVYVKPAFRKNGYAKALLNAIEDVHECSMISMDSGKWSLVDPKLTQVK